MTYVIAVVGFAAVCVLWFVVQRASGRPQAAGCRGAGECKQAPGDACARERGERCPNDHDPPATS